MLNLCIKLLCLLILYNYSFIIIVFFEKTEAYSSVCSYKRTVTFLSNTNLKTINFNTGLNVNTELRQNRTESF